MAAATTTTATATATARPAIYTDCGSRERKATQRRRHSGGGKGCAKAAKASSALNGTEKWRRRRQQNERTKSSFILYMRCSTLRPRVARLCWVTIKAQILAELLPIYNMEDRFSISADNFVNFLPHVHLVLLRHSRLPLPPSLPVPSLSLGNACCHENWMEP